MLAFHGAYSRLKRRPDQASIAMLLHSIEAGLVTKPMAASYTQPSATQRPTSRRTRRSGKQAAALSYVPPPAKEIARNETIAAMTQPGRQRKMCRCTTNR